MQFDAVAISKFGDALTSRGRSAHTVKAYTTDLTVFMDWIVKVPTSLLGGFDGLACEWLNKTRAEVAPKTTCRRLTSLRAYVKWAGLTCPDLDQYNPPTPARGTPHPIPEGITAVADMIHLTRDREKRALLALCGLAGLRVSEALSIPPDALDDASRTVLVRGKGDKSRVVPLSHAAWDYVAPALEIARRECRTYVVQLPDRTARDFITSIGKKVSDTPVSSHDLRATFATAAYNKSLNIRAVQELLGHASSQTTEVYIQVKMEEMRDAADLL